MISPDTKSWTWVLERECPECGYDGSVTRAADVASLSRVNAAEWRQLFIEGLVRAGRPNDETWSSLEYACHVRDVYRKMDSRIDAMLADDDPMFANWDQDETAVADRYEAQDPAIAVAELERAAEMMAARLDALTTDQWSRPGRRSDGASFTIDTIARYMAHDVIHHVWDVRQFSSLP
jgi:DinB superfamily